MVGVMRPALLLVLLRPAVLPVVVPVVLPVALLRPAALDGVGLTALVLQAGVAVENAHYHERAVEWARVQQDLDAGDIGRDEVRRAHDGPVDVGLGGEVDHDVVVPCHRPD